MLVLSRKLNEKIVLPTIGTTVQVVGIRQGAVRIAIDAPPEITVLREEVLNRQSEQGAARPRPEGRGGPEVVLGEFGRRLGARLKDTAMALGLLRLQMDVGQVEEARRMLALVQDDLQLLRFGLEGEAEAPAAKSPARKSKPQKALLVEDDRNERELLAGFLRQCGLNVDTAGDGSDALEYLGSHGRPDVVLLDMGLPRVDGPTTVREIRRNPAFAGLKIYGVTGHLPEEFDLEAGPGGIDHWFQKPLDPTALLRQLTEELDVSLCGG